VASADDKPVDRIVLGSHSSRPKHSSVDLACQGKAASEVSDGGSDASVLRLFPMVLSILSMG